MFDIKKLIIITVDKTVLGKQLILVYKGTQKIMYAQIILRVIKHVFGTKRHKKP